MTLDYIAGLIEGEGSFSFRHKPRYKTHKPCYVPCFRLALWDLDKELLEQVRDTIGVGKVSLKGHPPNGRTQYMLQIQGYKQCLALIDVLDRTKLYGQKAQSYTTWKQLVLETYADPRASTHQEVVSLVEEKRKEINPYTTQIK